MKNKICIVTGANSGTGKATSKLLLELDARVIMVVRNEQRGLTALNEIKEETGKDSVDLTICDFASPDSIKNFASDFKKKYDKLDVLINNHAIVLPTKHFTKEGIESTFAINHIGYFHLTTLLLDVLKASAPSRIINVASGWFRKVKKWPLSDYNCETRLYSPFKAYAETKLYNIMFTKDLAERLSGTGVTVNSYSPGYTRTRIGSQYWGPLKLISVYVGFMFGRSPEKSAKTAIFLASSPKVSNLSGEYFRDCKVHKTSDLSNNKQLQKELWDLSEKLTKMN